ncbi:MAG: divalent-cation tolerance protein CutA [candidate division WOR-3 bacterium]
MSRFIQVFVTTPKRNEAEQIARALVAERLAACAQVLGPVASTYRWQGRIERSKEWLCLVKTERRLLVRLTKVVQRLHSYDIPEVIGVAICGGNSRYLCWLGSTLGGKRTASRSSGRGQRATSGNSA